MCRRRPDTGVRDIDDSYQLYAVYDADGTVTGELSYLIGKLRGTRECALCDISHGWNPRGKTEWREGQRGASQLIWLHRDEQPEEVREVTGGRLPVVVLVRSNEASVLLDAAALSGCGGDYRQFEALLEQRLGQIGVGS